MPEFRCLVILDIDAVSCVVMRFKIHLVNSSEVCLIVCFNSYTCFFVSDIEDVGDDCGVVCAVLVAFTHVLPGVTFLSEY